MDGENIENDSVDGKHFIRFRGENSIFKFIRISVDGASDNLCFVCFSYVFIFQFSVACVKFQNM